MTTTNRRASKFFGGFSEQASLEVNDSNDTSQTYNQSPENEEDQLDGKDLFGDLQINL